jgi:hypothetical protein
VLIFLELLLCLGRIRGCRRCPHVPRRACSALEPAFAQNSGLELPGGRVLNCKGAICRNGTHKCYGGTGLTSSSPSSRGRIWRRKPLSVRKARHAGMLLERCTAMAAETLIGLSTSTNSVAQKIPTAWRCSCRCSHELDLPRYNTRCVCEGSVRM